MNEILMLAAEDGTFSKSQVVVIVIGGIMLWVALGKRR